MIIMIIRSDLFILSDNQIGIQLCVIPFSYVFFFKFKNVI